MSVDRVSPIIEEGISRAKILGQKYLVWQIIWPEQMASRDLMEQFCHALDTAGKLCADSGLVFNYHNHSEEFKPLNGYVPYDLIVEHTDPRTVKLEMDVYWAVAAKADPVAYFARYPGRYRQCHLKDGTADGELTAAGKGIVDFADVLRAARRAGIEHYYVEYDRADDPMAATRQFLRLPQKVLLSPARRGARGRSAQSPLCVAAAVALFAANAGAGAAGESGDYRTWSVYNGGPDSIHYSRLTQINTGNVRRLRPVWTYETGDAFGNGHTASELECNPIVIDDVLYATTPKMRIIALDAVDGKLLWNFNPHEGHPVATKQRSRGVTYWAAGDDRRIFTIADQYLYALDAGTEPPSPALAAMAAWICARDSGVIRNSSRLPI